MSSGTVTIGTDQFIFVPSIDCKKSDADLHRLIVPGTLDDSTQPHYARSLSRLFDSAVRAFPLPLWAPGLNITRELRNISESFFPWSEITPALRYLIRCSLRYIPTIDPLSAFQSWTDFLQNMNTITDTANPALLMKQLLSDEQLRKRWLFTIFLPEVHGGGFSRYPVQQEFLREWLDRQRGNANTQFTCLDAACGTGEGTWELLNLCSNCSLSADTVTIHGTSIEPLELWTAAHAKFPHDFERELRYQAWIRSHIKSDIYLNQIRFFQEDLLHTRGSACRYDVIICNGLIGGPLLNGTSHIERVTSGLIKRLKKGGLLLAADRFHEGWQRKSTRQSRIRILEHCGAEIIFADEGIGAIKK